MDGGAAGQHTKFSIPVTRGIRERVFGGLSGRLLLLTAMVVMLAEIVIFVPSLASFHRNWLADKLQSSELALLSVQAADGGATMVGLHSRLLERYGIAKVVLRRDTGEVDAQLPPDMELSMHAVPEVGPLRIVDLRSHHPLTAIRAAFGSLFANPHTQLRVVGDAVEFPGSRIEFMLVQDALQKEMTAFVRRIFALSVVLSLVTAGLVHYTLDRSIVRPIQSLTRQIMVFRDQPEDVSRAIQLSGRKDEIGQAEVALGEMEQAVRTALTQQQRLAALGSAVARLAHDLRNSLATAQIVSDRLTASDDPKVRMVAPRLERALLRASRLAEAALRYGRTDEPPPQIERVALAEALAEAAGDSLAPFPSVPFYNLVGGDVHIAVDRDYLHRILSNLMRNAAQAMTREPDEDDEPQPPPKLTAAAHQEGSRVRLTISDVGPGLPSAVMTRLFQPFSTAQRDDGTGLGLAIAKELARVMGGDLVLSSSTSQGTAFELILPAG